MKKLLLTTASLIAISFAASAQTDPPPATEVPTTTETPPPTTDTTGTGSGVATETQPVMLDSLGNPIVGEPAAPAAPPEKPTSRLKLYSGKHRGNNVIYNPK
jgi:hypothetical protein